jgi:hypothetical protein
VEDADDAEVAEVAHDGHTGILPGCRAHVVRGQQTADGRRQYLAVICAEWRRMSFICISRAPEKSLRLAAGAAAAPEGHESAAWVSTAVSGVAFARRWAGRRFCRAGP